MSVRETYEYNQLTWPEMNDAIEMQKVVILPTGSTEQHGPHGPLLTDVLIPQEVARRVATTVGAVVLYVQVVGLLVPVLATESVTAARTV